MISMLPAPALAASILNVHALPTIAFSPRLILTAEASKAFEVKGEPEWVILVNTYEITRSTVNWIAPVIDIYLMVAHAARYVHRHKPFV